MDELNNKLCDVHGKPITVENEQNGLQQNSVLIQNAISGDKKAFEQLYMQSYRYVFFVIRNIIPDDETTYDAIQETFIKVFKGIGDLRSPDAYYGWLTTIAKNTAKNFLRSKHTETPITEEEDYSDFLNQDNMQKEVSLDIEGVLKELEPQDAELLSLVYYDGMRVTQIAKMKGIPAATVYTQLNRAKRNLKAQLAVHGIDKAIYSGNFVAMVATAIRNIIGTSLLSVAIAQQILKGVVKGNSKKEVAVAKVIAEQQKKNILKIASCIVAISMITAALTVFALNDWSKSKPTNNNSSMVFAEDNTDISQEESSFDKTGSVEDTLQNSNQENTTHSGHESSDDTQENANGNATGGSSKNSILNSSLTESGADMGSQTDSSSNIFGATSNNPITPNPEEQTPDTPQNDDIFGNSVNNLSKYKSYGFMAKQGDWIYRGGNELSKIKTDGTGKEILYKCSDVIGGINVIGDTVYFTKISVFGGFSSGLFKIKTDGTGYEQVSELPFNNLIIRGNTAWFVDYNSIEKTSFSLYQLDLTSKKFTIIADGCIGNGLKTVSGNTLIYVDDRVIYAYDLSSGEKSQLYKSSGEIDALFINGNKIYAHIKVIKQTVELNLLKPNEVQNTSYKFNEVYNYVDYGDGAFYAQNTSGDTGIYSLDGTLIYKSGLLKTANTDVYVFDDGYIYLYDDSNTTIKWYRIKPDGTEQKEY